MRTGKIVGEPMRVATSADEGRLELSTRDGVLVHILCGRVVRTGDLIELRLAGRVWLSGRYDWSGIEARWAGLRVDLGGPWESQPAEAWKPAAVMALHPDAILRWPGG